MRLSLLARLCWALDAHRWLLSVANVVAALLFVAGCIAFYVPVWYIGSVTLFLLGSVLFLVTAVGHALLEHGPST
jgi:YrhK-like protein